MTATYPIRTIVAGALAAADGPGDREGAHVREDVRAREHGRDPPRALLRDPRASERRTVDCTNVESGMCES